MGRVRIKVLISLCIILLVASIVKITDVVAEYDDITTDNVYIGYFVGDKQLETMPEKDNSEGLIFNYGECNNGVTVEWNEDRWAPLIIGLNQNYTKCSLYFSKVMELDKDVPIVTSGNGLYEVKHDDLEELDSVWNKTEYRYAGSNPNNYVKFNNEIWRIIGLVNVKTNNGIEQRIKIVRQDGINNQKDFGSYAWDRPSGYTNNWTTSKLKDMLNGIYYESKTGECYSGYGEAIQDTCDFNTGAELPKGLDETAWNMIDKEVIWNIGGSSTYNDVTVKMFYERERGTRTGSDNTYPSEWSLETDVGEKHNGVGLIYPSDYGYATNGGSIGRETCFAKELYNWNSEDGNYKSECGGTDWLKPNSGYLWTLTPHTSNSEFADVVFSYGIVDRSFYNRGVYVAISVWPTLYLKSNIKLIDGTGSIDSPYELLLN